MTLSMVIGSTCRSPSFFVFLHLGGGGGFFGAARVPRNGPTQSLSLLWFMCLSNVLEKHPRFKSRAVRLARAKNLPGRPICVFFSMYIYIYHIKVFCVYVYIYIYMYM